MQNIRNVIAESETKEEEKQDFLPIFLRENKGNYADGKYVDDGKASRLYEDQRYFE